MTKLNSDYINAIIARGNSAPFLSFLPFPLERIDFDTCLVVVDIQPCHMQPHGIVSGDVIATLVDGATFRAPFARLPPDAGMVKGDLKRHYLKALSEGVLQAEGRCIRIGRSLSYAEAWIHSDEGDLIAPGTSSLMSLLVSAWAGPGPQTLAKRSDVRRL
jgi:uncharacterized protein (TIGR00369 family)